PPDPEQVSTQPYLFRYTDLSCTLKANYRKSHQARNPHHRPIPPALAFCCIRTSSSSIDMRLRNHVQLQRTRVTHSVVKECHFGVSYLAHSLKADLELPSYLLGAMGVR